MAYQYIELITAQKLIAIKYTYVKRGYKKEISKD
jgi:hypothetical protein